MLVLSGVNSFFTWPKLKLSVIVIFLTREGMARELQTRQYWMSSVTECRVTERLLQCHQ